MTTTLRISPKLALGDEFVTKTTAILAQRRKGKTYTASVIAEELVAGGIPFVALDPTGAWWGLRASVDGRKAGLPVTILGGQHGDVPLDRKDGRLVAELVVEHPGHYVVDLALFESAAAEREFAYEFAERLYRLKGHAGKDFPLHLFVDEADRFAPQKPIKGDERMLGAFEAIVRRGGLRGLGTTLITQRPAVINKNVLEQADILIVLRVVGPNDQDAIKRYVTAHGSQEELAALKESLASLKLGEAWIWEPGADPALFERVQIRPRRTFNSSATPKPGEDRIEPTKLAPVDVEAVMKQLASTVERAKADDPVELRKLLADRDRRVHALERELSQKTQEVVREEVVVEVVPEWFWGELGRLIDDLGQIQGAAARMARGLPDLVARAKGLRARTSPAPGEASGNRKGRTPQPIPPPRSSRGAATSTVSEPATSGEFRLSESQRRILDALAWFESLDIVPRRPPLAAVARVSSKSSGFEKNLSTLRTAGFIAFPEQGRVELTDAGRERANPPGSPATEADLQDAICAMVSGPQAELLRVLIKAYPDSLSRQDLADTVGVSPLSSGFEKNLSTLRSFELITYPAQGEVVALPVLFVEDGA